MSEFRDLLASFDLVQHVREPAHNLGDLIDLIITLHGLTIGDPAVTVTGFSDHSLVTCNLPVRISDATAIPRLEVRSGKDFQLITSNLISPRQYYVVT